MPRLIAVIPAALLVCAGAVIPLACSKAPEDGGADIVAESRLADLEAKVRDLAAENEEARQALGTTGRERGSLARAVGDMREEIRRLREDLAAKGSAASPAGEPAGTSSSGSTPSPASTSPGGTSFTPASDGSFTPAQVADFDAIWKVAEKKRQEEAERKRLHDALTQADLTLTPEQEAAVAKLNRDYSEKRNELFRATGGRRGRPNTEADGTELRAKVEELQTQHEADLRSILPAGDAERVVAALKQSYPGFFRRDPNARPNRGGMQGN